MRIVSAVGIMVLLAGCGGKSENSSGVTGLSAAQSSALNAEHSKFEKSKDPPFKADTRFAAGRLAESHGAIPQAINQYSEAVKIDPNHQGSWYRLGVLYAKAKQFPQAINAWENYVKATKGDAGAFSNLGFCYEVAGDREKAEIAYRRGIAKEPKNIPCRVNYGLMLARAGRESEAIQQLQAVLTPAETYYNLGSVHEQAGRKEQAKAHYRKALEFNPNLWEAQTRLAQMK